MRIAKALCSILAMAIAILFAGLLVVQAGSGLNIWPTEPNVQGSVKTKATFSAYEYISEQGGDWREAVFILRVRTGNSWTWNFITAYTLQPYPYYEDYPRQVQLMQFLNSDAVLSAICPDCPEPSYVHIKRAYDDGLVYDTPYAAVADFELVVNQEMPPWLEP